MTQRDTTAQRDTTGHADVLPLRGRQPRAWRAPRGFRAAGHDDGEFGLGRREDRMGNPCYSVHWRAHTGARAHNIITGILALPFVLSSGLS